MSSVGSAAGKVTMVTGATEQTPAISYDRDLQRQVSAASHAHIS